MRERPAQFVLPTAQQSLHQTLRRVVEHARAFCVLPSEHLLIKCDAVLHWSSWPVR